MKIYEVKKGEADIRHGLVMMAIEGSESAIQALSIGLEYSGFSSTRCADPSDKDGWIIEYFMVRRSDLPEFKINFSVLKSIATRKAKL